MTREYQFDRYRNGRKMAEGLILTKPESVDDAVAVASRLAEAGDVFVLREDRARLATVVAERDAARAGEARAVEALRAVVAGAYPHEVEIWTMEGAVLRHVHRVLDQHEPTLDNQPPTQQRAEAAAEALEKLAADLRQDPWGTTLHDVDSLRSILRTRAAALRAGEVGND